MNFKKWSTSVQARLLLAIWLAVTGMVSLCASALISEKATLLDDRKIKTRQLVETAYGVLAHYHDLQKRGELAEDAAKKAAIAMLRTMRYDKTEYFWVNDFTAPFPKMVMHPAVPALEGTVLDADKFNCATSQQAGIDGAVEKTDGRKNLFKAMNEVAAKAGRGFVTYEWPKPVDGGGATKELYTKLSYVQKFDAWDWLIGSGIYIDDVDSMFWQSARWLIAIAAVATALIAALLLMMMRSITRPLGELREAMRTMQETQDLSRALTIREDNEIGAIGHSFNAMIESLQGIIRQVVAGVRQITDDAVALSGSSQRVAASALLQSSETASMAAAIEEMSVSINHVAESSRESYSAARQTEELSAAGCEIVKNSALEMSRISDSVNHATQVMQTLGEKSTEISAIVSEIKEIADQTNLLALNAAIEAARAGEQGRGFAVVADEVRKLAERTTRSTTEIAAMIGSIQSGTDSAVANMDEGATKVRNGVTMANQAGESLQHISAGAGQVVAAVGEISNALREQSAASGQIATSVERIAQMTEKNSGEVAEISRTAQSLERLAGALQEAVGRFKV